MSALESMMRSVLGAMDIDVEALKVEATSRIASFERNVSILNTTLISHDKKLARIETMLELICENLQIVVPTTNATETLNGGAISGIQHTASIGDNPKAVA